MTVATIDLAEVARLIPGYDPWAGAEAGRLVFDEDAAALALAFFPECLKHVKGRLAGQAFELEDWQAAIVANLFGWKRPDGTRRYREAFTFVPRKNGKTTLAAGILCYVLFCDGEAGAEIYSSAADRHQASLVFEQVVGMIRQEPLLMERCVIYGGGPGGQSKTVALQDHSGSYKALSADAKTKHGFNTHFVVNDELHAHRTRELIDVLETSTGSRSQPLIFHITTADYDRESICNEKRDYAEKVRDGIIDNPAFLPVLFGAGKDDDWTNPNVWAAANPCLGVSLSEEYMAAQCQKAQDSPAYENTFKRLHLNITTEQATRWLSMDVWDACAGAVDEQALKGTACWAGLDLSTTTDISAFVLVFPDAGNAVLPFFWCPGERTHERELKDRVPYETWARQGFIKRTEGNSIDYRQIRADINALGERFGIQEIAYDPWNATQLATELEAEDGFLMVQFRQGAISMNEPMKHLEGLLLNGDVAHGGNPVLRWMASNIAIRTDPSENLRPDKAASSDRIDGVVALIMALGRSMIRQGDTGSVYEDRGLLTM